MTEIATSVDGYGLIIHRHNVAEGGLVQTEKRFATYGGALARAQSLEAQLARGRIQILVYRLEVNSRHADGLRWQWLETRGGIR